ncbi:uncharacterized protein [Oryza sativa Japonica Group]|uniref:Os05g0552100 protein n=3 Tax=Oryza TaxID=4527 RepID=B9FHV1_ORYSJ|nr:uncharacterized protein LOC4339537 [Oryza sativa Japonica Group]XP_015637373.1 uncharacterized protein LOC4339537 [Oryza sativa Japonica Group]XP_015637374.1 uncharacterized protein LOC4339537 [Oryza sativa Japonica Group]XP_015637375.1 uncharacterized protein LOC4339537 [Oryza sativa Japonica Group]XP_015637376.1 uncharacterized protein LOC4339537 [Oryza sativa Japonica Group]AAT85190.1 unknown protein [Oryza sativa Japonica Group]EEE64613.1 hypothetical protein OsJ_19465 [Oryza sativa Ja|eukprot:NP_001056252.1 Os05g0552100 [Oryza sativa Japonica Group]
MSDPGEPSKHSQWMSHWTKGSSSAEPQVGRSNDSPEDAKYDICEDNSGPSNFEIMKSRLFERLMVGISQERASLEHGQKLNSNMKVVVKDARRHAVQNQIDQGDGPIQKSVMQKDVLYAKAVVSKSLSIQKLSELSVDCQKLAGSDDLSSEWNHFPMLAINRKIDSILNPKRKSAKSTGPNDVFVPKQTLKLNMTTANLMAFSSQEYELHSHRTTDETMDHCKHAGGIVSRLEDHAGVMLNPAEQKLKGQLLPATSCSCSKDDSNSSDSLLDEQHTSRYIADSDQEPTCRSREKRLKSSENNDTNCKIGSCSQNQKSRAPGHHKHKGSAGVMFRTSVPGKEFEAAEINCSDKINQRHLNTQRIVSAANVTGSCIPDPAADISTVNGRGEAVTQPSSISGDSTKRKAPYLFEMLTIPSKAQNMNPEDSLPSGNSTAFGVHMYGTNIGSHLFGANNKSSTETEILSGDSQHVSKSSAGIASLLAQKAKSEQLATLYMKGASGCNVNEHQGVSSKAIVANKQQCYNPRTARMDLDLMQFQLSRMRNQESQARTEPGDRWLKRLQIDSKDPHHLPCSKRSKAGDGSGRPVTGGASSMAPRCDGSNDDDDIVDRDHKEEQGLDEGVEIQGGREASPVPAKSDDRWIGRWCQGGVPVYHEDDHDQRKEVTKPDLAAGDSGGLEGQFPSIKAMAMMGRAMSKVRPCQEERRGSFMVWKA